MSCFGHWRFGDGANPRGDDRPEPFRAQAPPRECSGRRFPVALGRPAKALRERQDEQRGEPDDDHGDADQKRAAAAHGLSAEEPRDLHRVPRPP